MLNSYINFIVEQLFAANKYFNDQEPWKKKSDKLLKWMIENILPFENSLPHSGATGIYIFTNKK